MQCHALRQVGGIRKILLYDGNLGRNSPLEFITDSQPVSLNMTKEMITIF